MFSHPYISLFHLLVNIFSVIVIRIGYCRLRRALVVFTSIGTVYFAEVCTSKLDTNFHLQNSVFGIHSFCSSTLNVGLEQIVPPANTYPNPLFLGMEVDTTA